MLDKNKGTQYTSRPSNKQTERHKMMLEQLSLYLAIDETLFYLAILIPGECMGRASDRA